jgi:hypothetical protein
LETLSNETVSSNFQRGSVGGGEGGAMFEGGRNFGCINLKTNKFWSASPIIFAAEFQLCFEKFPFFQSNVPLADYQVKITITVGEVICPFGCKFPFIIYSQFIQTTSGHISNSFIHASLLA